MVIREERGFTLIELLVTCAILAIMASMAGYYWWDHAKKNILYETTRLIYGVAQGTRVEAMTNASSGASRGHGITFTSGALTRFEFIDGDGDFVLDSGESQNAQTTTVPSAVSLLTKDGTPLAATIIFDQRGLLRTTSWGTTTGLTVRLRYADFGVTRCISITEVMIREGVWNDGTAKCDAK